VPEIRFALDYAAIWYSWMSPPSTSRRRTWETTTTVSGPGGSSWSVGRWWKADKQWLQDTFDEAGQLGSAGVMIIWRADPGFDTSGFQGGPKRDPKTLAQTDVPANQDGFQSILVKLRSGTTTTSTG
jgi:hypothetical protein